jgi:hypothetical protein
MRKTIIIALSIILAASMAAAETEINGYIKLDERILTEKPSAGDYARDRVYLDLKAQSQLSDQIAAYGELKIRTGDSPDITAAEDLMSKSTVTPVSIELHEAYFDIFAWPLRNTDLRLGKQRLAWGTADRFNQVDNLNPYDLSDLLEFGKKLPTKALKMDNYLWDNTLSLVILPEFTPAVLPSTYIDFISDSISAQLPSGTSLATMETNVLLPSDDMSHAMYGAKFSRNVGGTDLSLSYFNGYDSIPSPQKVVLTAVSPTTLLANVTLDYPKIGVFGCDLAGDFNDIGYWAEVAFIYPDNVTQKVIAPTGTTTIEIGQYTKYTLGLDYRWENGFYLNTQWMHGFFDERGKDLTDFIITRVEKKIMDDKVELALTWLGEVNDNSAVVGNLWGPKITFFPADATEIEIGTLYIEGDMNTKLETYGDQDQFFIRAKYSF